MSEKVVELAGFVSGEIRMKEVISFKIKRVTFESNRL